MPNKLAKSTRGHFADIPCSCNEAPRCSEYPPLHPFAGIAEKLNRSNENIRNLESEIAAFFDESKYPLLSHDNQKVIPEALEYHRGRQIPPDSASCLARSSTTCGRASITSFGIFPMSLTGRPPKYRKFIEFPILEKPPSDVFTQYERKIQGIANTAVRSLIEDCQPYKRPEPQRVPSLGHPQHGHRGQASGIGYRREYWCGSASN